MASKIYTYGKKENQAILFVHGFPFDHTMWDKLIELLKEEYYCVAYDVLGLGFDNLKTNTLFTFEDMADQVFEVIKSNDIKQPIICGLSMGGYITYRALEKDQSVFKAGIICGSKAEADGNDTKLRRAQAVRIIRDKNLLSYIKEFIPSTFGDTFKQNNMAEIEAIIEHSNQFNPDGVAQIQICMASRTDSLSVLPTLKLPVLFLSGREDTLTTPEQLRWYADHVSNSQFNIIEDAGHLFPIENPKKAALYLDKFIKNL